MKIALAIISGDQILKATHTCFVKMVLHMHGRHEMALLDCNSSQPSMTSNTTVHQFLTGTNFEWLGLIDSDMRFPPDAFDRLLAHNEPLVAATYPSRGAPHQLLGSYPDLSPVRGDETGLGGPMRHLPQGMMLIHRSVLETIGWPWFQEMYSAEHPLVMAEACGGFCLNAGKHGFKLMCDFDLSREIFHLGTVNLGWGMQ